MHVWPAIRPWLDWLPQRRGFQSRQSLGRRASGDKAVASALPLKAASPYGGTLQRSHRTGMFFHPPRPGRAACRSHSAG